MFRVTKSTRSTSGVVSRADIIMDFLRSAFMGGRLVAQFVIHRKGFEMSDFGSGIGTIIGANMGANDLENAQTNVNNSSSGFNDTVAPYNTFGQSFLPTASDTIGQAKSFSGNTMGYDQFMSGYTNTPAAEYQLQQANAVQNNSAAAKGGLLSGSNERALGTIDNGIVSQNANTAYNEYLAGNNQQFGQLESALGNMFSAIGVGTTATGQEAGVTSANMSANASIAAAQAKNDQSKGSGIGSLFSGIGSAAAMF